MRYNDLLINSVISNVALTEVETKTINRLHSLKNFIPQFLHSDLCTSERKRKDPRQRVAAARNKRTTALSNVRWPEETS